MAFVQRTLEDVRIVKRNFSGVGSEFNDEGRRNFLLLLRNKEEEQQMIDDGWYVKYLAPRDPEDEPQPFVKVNVSYVKFEPDIWIVRNGKRTRIHEEDVNMLDWCEIEKIDLTITQSRWERKGRSGISAYLKSMFVWISMSDLEAKYADVPETDGTE